MRGFLGVDMAQESQFYEKLMALLRETVEDPLSGVKVFKDGQTAEYQIGPVKIILPAPLAVKDRDG